MTDTNDENTIASNDTAPPQLLTEDEQRQLMLLAARSFGADGFTEEQLEERSKQYMKWAWQTRWAAQSLELALVGRVEMAFLKKDGGEPRFFSPGNAPWEDEGSPLRDAWLATNEPTRARKRGRWR